MRDPGLQTSFLKPCTTSDFKIMYKELGTRDLPARVEPGVRGRRGHRLLHRDLIDPETSQSSLCLPQGVPDSVTRSPVTPQRNKGAVCGAEGTLEAT